MNGLIKTFYSTNKVKFSLKNPALEVSTIRVRTNINGERFSYYLPSKYKLNRSCWDSEAGRAIEDAKKNPQLKGNPQLQLIMRNINKEIEKTQNALIMILELCQAHGVTPTLEQVRTELRKELLGEQPEEQEEEKESKPLITDFFELANYYIELCENQSILNQKGEKFAKGSIYNHKAALKIVKEFCEYANIKKLSLEDVDVYFYAAFLKYMTTEAEHDRGKYKTNGIGKIVKSIKVFARFAHENGYTLNDSYRKFKVFREEVETVYLNETELTALYNLKLPENLAQVRDAFLVSCYTGLRYGDMARLEQKHFHDSTGTIEIDTQKTKERVVIPIHPKVREIFEKYNQAMPKVQCNQATNRNLKTICKAAGITELITRTETIGGKRTEVTYHKYELVSSHTARRSFATNAYKSGMPTLSIMKLTGHRTETSFMKYIRIGKEENAEILSNYDFFKQ
ncbi:site-specific integrase [Bacteroides clarus]|uniref:site-specific integrase n=1 Tax=Bacteroides clarus TaxID=626929 RepID=UPI00210161D9|nr:site-specific integrase [Bacteroides clarus]MCQ1545156.1 site-specific integrase [Bacteroides clarus]